MFLLNFANTSCALLVPCALILHTRAELLPGFALTMATCILWLKLVSYAHVNWDYRSVCGGRPRCLHPAGHGGSSCLQYPAVMFAARWPQPDGPTLVPCAHPAPPCPRHARRHGEVRAGERGGPTPPPEGASQLLRYPENIR